jgi:hypothetical protein
MPSYIPELGKTIPVKEPIAIFAPFWRTNSTSWVYILSYSAKESGRYVISGFAFTESSANPCYVEILIGGYVVTSITTYQTTPQIFSIYPQYVEENQLIEVRVRSSSSSYYVNCGSILVTRISE